MTAGRLGAAPAVNVGREALRSAAGCLPSSFRPPWGEPVEPPPAAPPCFPPPVDPPPPLLPPPLPLPPALPDGSEAGGAGKLTVVDDAGDSRSPPPALRRRATIVKCWSVPL